MNQVVPILPSSGLHVFLQAEWWAPAVINGCAASFSGWIEEFLESN